MKKTAHYLFTIAAAFSTSLACAQVPADPGPPPRRDGPPSEGRRPDGPTPDDRGPRREDGGRPGLRPPDARPPREMGFGGLLPQPSRPQPFLGVMTSPLSPALNAQLGLSDGLGLTVDEVLPDSPAAKAGLQKHDVLKAINDQLLTNPAQLATLVRHYGKGSDVSLTVIRKGAEQKLAVNIGERLMPEWRAADPAEALPRRLEEHRRNMEERVREWEGRGNDRNDRARDPQDRPPQPPVVPPQPALPPQPPQPPRAGSGLVTPGGAGDLRAWQDQSSTTWNTASARVTLKDESGEMEVRSENGKRTLTAKDAKGETVFNGPIDSEEQRQAVPEAFRKKLGQVDARTRLERRLSAQGQVEGDAPEPLRFDRVAPSPEPEIQ